MDPSDDTLARAAAKGDRDAFALLVGRLYDRVFALAFRLTGSRAEAEDLTQDICAALPAKLAQFRGEAKVSTWLHRVTVNAARDRFRRQATHKKAAQGWGDWEIDRRAALDEEAERHAWLIRAMAALAPPELRETLILVLEGLSHAEVGAALGISEGTVSWRISEAKKKLALLKESFA